MPRSEWERLSAEATRAYMERWYGSLEAYLRTVARGRVGYRDRDSLAESDIVQATWAAAYRRLKNDRGPRAHQSIEFWLRDVLIDIVRQKLRVIRRVGLLLDFEPTDPALSPGTQVVSDEQRKRLERLFASLPEEARTIADLYWFENLSRAEIARRVDRGVPFVRQKLKSVVDQFRRQLSI